MKCYIKNCNEEGISSVTWTMYPLTTHAKADKVCLTHKRWLQRVNAQSHSQGNGTLAILT